MNAETRLAFIIIGEKVINWRDFESLQSYDEGDFAKNPIKSLNELNWLINSHKYLVAVGSRETNILSDFLNSEKEFFMKHKPRIYLFGVKMRENREALSGEMETFRWEDLPHLAPMLRESVEKLSFWRL